jgi:hypothetical protein
VPKLPTYYGIRRHDEGEITFTGLVKLIKKFKQMCLDFVPMTSNSWKISKSDQFMFVFSFSHSLNHLALRTLSPVHSYIAPRVPNIIPVGLCIFIPSHISLLSNSWAWPKHAHNMTNLVAFLDILLRIYPT